MLRYQRSCEERGKEPRVAADQGGGIKKKEIAENFPWREKKSLEFRVETSRGLSTVPPQLRSTWCTMDLSVTHQLFAE